MEDEPAPRAVLREELGGPAHRGEVVLAGDRGDRVRLDVVARDQRDAHHEHRGGRDGGADRQTRPPEARPPAPLGGRDRHGRGGGRRLRLVERSQDPVEEVGGGHLARDARLQRGDRRPVGLELAGERRVAGRRGLQARDLLGRRAAERDLGGELAPLVGCHRSTSLSSA